MVKTIVNFTLNTSQRMQIFATERVKIYRCTKYGKELVGCDFEGSISANDLQTRENFFPQKILRIK